MVDALDRPSLDRDPGDGRAGVARGGHWFGQLDLLDAVRGEYGNVHAGELVGHGLTPLKDWFGIRLQASCACARSPTTGLACVRFSAVKHRFRSRTMSA